MQTHVSLSLVAAMHFRNRIIGLVALSAVCGTAPAKLHAHVRAVARHANDTAAAPRSPSQRSADLLLRSVLRVSGYDKTQVDHWQHVLARFAAKLRARGTVAGDSRQKAQVIHAYVRNEILRGKFDAAESDLGVALSGGSFNCASASALFLAMAREFELDARAVSVLGHVWCRVKTEQGTLEVETTARDWFAREAAGEAASPQERSPLYQEHLRRVAQSRPLDDAEFLAIFHYNRGVGLFRAGRLGDAAAANLAALVLDPACRPAYENFAACAQVPLAGRHVSAPPAGANAR
jgi:hypothetical protein